jgi:predicted acetyltransferase
VLFGSAEALLELAARDRGAFLGRLHDRADDGVRYFADGSTAPALPALYRWMWDDQFVGNIDLRWPHGGGPLPDDVPGHIGYGTVEWLLDVDTPRALWA